MSARWRVCTFVNGVGKRVKATELSHHTYHGTHTSLAHICSTSFPRSRSPSPLPFQPNNPLSSLSTLEEPPRIPPRPTLKVHQSFAGLKLNADKPYHPNIISCLTLEQEASPKLSFSLHYSSCPILRARTNKALPTQPFTNYVSHRSRSCHR